MNTSAQKMAESLPVPHGIGKADMTHRFNLYAYIHEELYARRDEVVYKETICASSMTYFAVHR